MTSKQSTYIPELDYSEAKLMSLIDSISQTGDFTAKLDAASASFIDIPYEADTLVGSASSPEKYVAKFKCFDCVTYVETILALALSSNLNEFYETLRKIRYESGNISWEARNHYMSDWIERNEVEGFCKSTQCEGESIEITRKLSIISDYPEKTKSINFIPFEKIINDNFKFSPGLLICFGTNRDNLDVTHCGLLFESDNGPVLRHASRSKQKVVEEPLADFMKRFGNSPGAIICELGPNKT